jgi:hypothetical protein
VNKIVNGVLKFKSLGNATVRFDKSGYAALGWSVVAFSLSILENAQEMREFVFSSSNMVTHYMERYRRYEILFRSEQGVDDEFDKSITNVYKQILLYSLSLSHFLEQSELGKTFEQVY